MTDPADAPVPPPAPPPELPPAPPPPADETFSDWQALAPAAVRWHIVWSVVLVPIPIVGAWIAPCLFSSVERGTATWIGICATILCVLNVARTAVWARRFRFRLTDTTAETRSEVLTVTTRVVPLGRIQHVDVTSGPIERMLGLATVAGHTAAGDSTIALPGVTARHADLLRDRLLRERRREAL